MKVSVAIIAHNAAEDLDRCLQSVAFADERIVVDQGSTDGTAEVCARRKAQLHQRTWQGYGATKQEAVGLCRNRWVLSLDSDEEVSPRLRETILALPDAPDEAAFAVNRLSCFLGKWIRHCGWHPEFVVRLFDKERAGFNDRPVHESVEVSGGIGRLAGLLHHYSYQSMEQYITKLNRYTSLAAADLQARGKTASLAEAVMRAQAAFWRMWLLQKGFLDGWVGTVLCLASSFYVLTKYTKLWRLGRHEGSGDTDRPAG